MESRTASILSNDEGKKSRRGSVKVYIICWTSDIRLISLRSCKQCPVVFYPREAGRVCSFLLLCHEGETFILLLNGSPSPREPRIDERMNEHWRKRPAGLPFRSGPFAAIASAKRSLDLSRDAFISTRHFAFSLLMILRFVSLVEIMKALVF